MVTKDKSHEKISPRRGFYIFIALLLTAAFIYFRISGNATGDGFCVHFIDVGQGDCILIQGGQTGILIDAGEASYGAAVCSYIADAGVRNLEYVVATHPHSDHIGGLSETIYRFRVGKVVMPDVTANTASFEKLLTAIDDTGVEVIFPVSGLKLPSGIEGLTLTVLSSGKNEYENANDYSVVVRAVYGKTSFLFAGDAEAAAEREMVSSGANLKADVLKIASRQRDKHFRIILRRG